MSGHLVTQTIPRRAAFVIALVMLGLTMAACIGPDVPTAGVPTTAATPTPGVLGSLSPTPGNATSAAPSPSLAVPEGTIGPDGWKDPSNFVATIDNPWLPFKPGMVWHYTGTKDGERAKDVTTVTSRTEVVAGVPCVVVDDKLFLNGKLEETTLDYYVQDRAGNVWYFGEDTQELDANGNITSTEGSWRTGVDGAVPGIFMEGDPVIGHAFQQEYLAGQAEDNFEVLSLTASVTVPAGTYNIALLTKEWTPLEPDVLDHKWYVRGIGEVRELAVKGPKEELSLVSVSGL
jgi:hypothetical protein